MVRTRRGAGAVGCENSVLDASWDDSLGDLDADLSDGDCLEAIELSCAICQSRGLDVAGDGFEGTLLHGDRFDAGPWTFEVARLLSCEATCSPGIHPLYILATIHESVVR